VRDAATHQPFPADVGAAARVYQAALEEGIVTYPIQGCVDGESGDHILLAPPFILSAEESREIARGLEAALTRVARELGAN
jgi:adenosylmethionine-8-amino-7-oxononanoate aminotransferase